MKLMILTILVISVLSPVFQDAWCQAGTPTDQVRKMLEGVMTIQTDPQFRGDESKNHRKTAIKKIIAENFHFDGMAKNALGLYWNEVGEVNRSEFRSIFQDLFQESYTRLVLDFLKKEKILYNKEENRQGQVLVRTVIQRVGEEIPVDYVLTPVEAKWLVNDVKIDGVSIVQNYQKSFSRVIKQESFEGLLRKMRLQQQVNEKAS